MNKTIFQILLTIVFILAVMAYVVYNYIQGNSDMPFFVVAMGFLGIFLLNMIRGLIQILKDR